MRKNLTRWVARTVLPFLFIFLTVAPIRAYAIPYAVQGMWAYWGAYMTSSAALAIQNPTLVVPYITLGAGSGTLLVGATIGYLAVCPAISIMTPNSPCDSVPLGTGSAATPSNNPTNAPPTAPQTPANNPTSTPAGFTNGAICNPTCGPYSASWAVCVATAYSCSYYIGSPAGCTYNTINGSAAASTGSQAYADAAGAAVCTTGQKGSDYLNTPTCPNGYSVSGSTCNLTNGLKVNGVVVTTMTRSGQTITVNLPTSTAPNQNTNANSEVSNVYTNDTFNTSAINPQTGQPDTLSVQATSSGSTVIGCVSNGNSTISCQTFTTDQNGTVTSVSPVVTQTGSIGGGSSSTPNVPQNAPLTGTPSNITPFSAGSAVVGQSGVECVGATCASGYTPSTGNGGNGSGTGTSFLGSGSSVTGNGISSGVSGQCGDAQAGQPQCITQDVTMGGYTAASMPSDGSGAASAVAGYLASAVAAASNSGVTVAIASQVNVASSIGATASGVTGTWSWYWPAAGSGSNLANCQAAFGGGGNTVNQIHGNTWIDLCSDPKWLELPALLDWFLGISVMMSVFVRATTAFEDIT